MTPTDLHILSQHWTVKHVEDRNTLLVYGEDEENEVGKDTMGICNSGTHEITIRVHPSVSHDAERDTLLHETLHAVLALTGIDQHLSTKQAEDYICRLAPAILSLMRENPEFVAYLLEREDV